MAELTSAYGLWILIFIHVTILFEVIIICCFKSKRQSQVLSISPNQDNGKTADSTFDDTTLMKFPKLSCKVYISVLKKNHLFLKIFFRNLSRSEWTLQIISHNIILIGILGITGMEIKAWPSINSAISGISAAILARIFHFFYGSLQVKQSVLFINISSEDKLVIAVESEVMRRLNVHRTMRRVLGFLIMFLYYIGNIYYSIRYILLFEDPLTFYWLSSFMIGSAALLLFIEPVKLLLQIEAANYLKSGGSKTLEALSGFLVSDELLATFN